MLIGGGVANGQVQERAYCITTVSCIYVSLSAPVAPLQVNISKYFLAVVVSIPIHL